MTKGIEFEDMKGRCVGVSIDEDEGVALIRVDLNGQRVESSTGKTLVCATGYHTFQYRNKRHSLRVNFLENITKGDLAQTNEKLLAKIAKLEAAGNDAE